jgi:hypothetical protein
VSGERLGQRAEGANDVAKAGVCREDELREVQAAFW